jgi:hypothetical protein
MRILNWNPNVMDQTFEDVAIERIVEACEVVRRNAVRNLIHQIGKGETTGIDRPPYKTGKYAGAKWTGREFGTLLRSSRVVQKKTKTGKPLHRRRDVRIIIGTYMAWYALIFEYYRPYMRPALDQSIPAMKNIIGVR